MIDKEISVEFCKNVKYICENSGIMIGEVEKNAGISRGYISRQKRISLDCAYNIANYLDMSLDSMVSKTLEKEQKIKALKKHLEDVKKEIAELEENDCESDKSPARNTLRRDIGGYSSGDDTEEVNNPCS